MNLKDKICLITGATSGIGKKTAISMAKRGATVIFTARNNDKAKKVRQEITEATGNINIEYMHCDLSSFDSIRSFAKEFRTKYQNLHILINNAGIWENREKNSIDGIEMNFAVNHLASFLLTNLLLDLIKDSAPARIINTSSMAHKFSKANFDDVENKNSWGSMKSYSWSKLCNILFTKKLSQILSGTKVTVNCLHPGLIRTGLFVNMNSFIRWLSSPFMLPAEKGAQTTIYLATSDEVENISGEYFSKKKISNPSKAAKDIKAADKLWEISKKYVSI